MANILDARARFAQARDLATAKRGFGEFSIDLAEVELRAAMKTGEGFRGALLVDDDGRVIES
jgi:hypothetical protein